jgi:ABC-type sugar transport system substrate-binding protein
VKPARSEDADICLSLPGGTRENDLWVEATVDEGEQTVLVSTWDLSPEEVDAIVEGAKVRLVVWGQGHPPVALGVEGVEPT